MPDLTPDQQKDTPFPMCARRCAPLQHFGVCECEALCPHKFDSEGNPINHKPTA
jgi:hypothetical protein